MTGLSSNHLCYCGLLQHIILSSPVTGKVTGLLYISYAIDRKSSEKRKAIM